MAVEGEPGQIGDVRLAIERLDPLPPTTVPDKDSVTVVVVGGLGPRTGAGNVASAYVEPLTLGVPARYISHNPLLYREGVGTLELKDIALRQCICASENKVSIVS